MRPAPWTLELEDERHAFFTDDQSPFSLLTEKVVVGKTSVVFSSHLSLVIRGIKPCF